MGIYLDPPLGGRIQSKKDWLSNHGRRTYALTWEEDETPRSHCFVFWQRAPWGENAAVAFDTDELKRLANSAVFEAMYVVSRDSLRLAGMQMV